MIPLKETKKNQKVTVTFQGTYNKMINAATKKIFLETYGCQMNEYDSELIRSILAMGEFQFLR